MTKDFPLNVCHSKFCNIQFDANNKGTTLHYMLKIKKKGKGTHQILKNYSNNFIINFPLNLDKTDHFENVFFDRNKNWYFYFLYIVRTHQVIHRILDGLVTEIS